MTENKVEENFANEVVWGDGPAMVRHKMLLEHEAAVAKTRLAALSVEYLTVNLEVQSPTNWARAAREQIDKWLVAMTNDSKNSQPLRFVFIYLEPRFVGLFETLIEKILEVAANLSRRKFGAAWREYHQRFKVWVAQAFVVVARPM